MKTLLFTGSSGFVGSNILLKLKEKYFIDTLDFSDLSTYTINLADQVPSLNKQYDIVLHAAGKAHCKHSISKENKIFYDVNYQGTRNLCLGLENAGLPRSFIFISTVAVYGCNTGETITEDHPLNEKAHYGRSKIQAEEFLLEWCERKKVSMIVIRPSLLAGKNPPGNLGAMIKGIASGKYIRIADGMAKKSIAMAEDIGRLVPYCVGKSGIYNLCDDYHPSFRELEELICKQLNRPLPLSIPIQAAKFLARIGDFLNLTAINSNTVLKMTQSLTFSNERIKNELNFIPSNVLTSFKII